MKCTCCGKKLGSSSFICPYCSKDNEITQKTINEVKAKNPATIAFLYNLTSEDVYIALAMVVKNEDKVAELMEESYVTAFENIDKLKFPKAFPDFIKKTAYEVAQKHLNCKK